MFDSLFTVRSTIQRHRSAPLRSERERFLEHVSQRAIPRKNLQQYASTLLHIIRILRLKNLRAVSTDQVRAGAQLWLDERRRNGLPKNQRNPADRFVSISKQFLKFHGRLVRPRPSQPFSGKIERFEKFMRLEHGLRPASVSSYHWHASQFLKWYATLHKAFSQASLADTDAYFVHKSEKWNGRTLAEAANTLRCLFRYAHATRWCRRVNANAIKAVFPRETHGGPSPQWEDVQRLLRCEKLETRASMRVQVLITLFALYGLRTSEATNLLLKNIDWKTKTFTVRRAKNYKLQRFPIMRSFEAALKRYLEFGRPNCQSEYVIVTLHAPYRPLFVHDVAQIINKRMDHAGIKRAYGGPRYLRHACATRLLTEEMTLQEIADFLGHQDCMTVGVYAQHDLSSLGPVAAVDLCRGLRNCPKRSLAAWNRPGSAYMYLPSTYNHRE
jgi:integrase/recombinase XerD